MKGILIDPEHRIVREVQVGKDYKEIYKHIDCSCFTTIQMDSKNTLFLDDEGLLRSPRYFFILTGYHQPLAGKALLLGCTRAGDSTSASWTVKKLAAITSFTELEVEGFDTKVEENVEMPGGGTGTRISTTPVFKKRK
jgi:hypothetical protein